MIGLSVPLASPLVTYSTASFRRSASPVTSRMLYPLTVGIFRIISSTGIGVLSSLSAPYVGDTLKGQCSDQLGKVRATYGIEDNTRAIAFRDARHFGKYVLLLGYN